MCVWVRTVDVSVNARMRVGVGVRAQGRAKPSRSESASARARQSQGQWSGVERVTGWNLDLDPQLQACLLRIASVEALDEALVPRQGAYVPGLGLLRAKGWSCDCRALGHAIERRVTAMHEGVSGSASGELHHWSEAHSARHVT